MSEYKNKMDPARFYEIPHQDVAHRTFILKDLVQRYESYELKKSGYVLIYHFERELHFVIGLYDNVREVLIARHAANMMLMPLKDGEFVQAHLHDGPGVVGLVYDPITDNIKDFVPPEGLE